MPQLNDCVLAALLAGGYGDQYNDGLLAWCKANGATSDDLNDALLEAAIVNGGTSPTLNDAWYEMLEAFGLPGTLNDKQFEFWCVNGGSFNLTLNAITLSTVIPLFGDFGVSFNRADTDATVKNHEGVIENVLSQEIRFLGARRVRNAIGAPSEDWTDAAWAKSNVNATADTLTATAANGNVAIASPYTENVGAHRLTVDLQRISGTGDIQIGGPVTGWTTVPVTTQNQRFSIVMNIVGAALPGIQIVTNGDSIRASKIQFEYVENQTDQNPAEYVSVGVLAAVPYHGSYVDGVKCFETFNGNTVDGNGVVTAGSGAGIPTDLLNGFQVEKQTISFVFRNREFDNAYWGKTGFTVTPNNTKSPVGIVDAETLTVSSVTYPKVQRGFAGLSTTLNYSYSVFAKAGTFDRFGLELRGSDVPADTPDVMFDLTNGTVLSTTAGRGLINPSIEEFGDGWYRLSVTVQPVVTSSQLIYGIGTGEGQQIGDTVHLWGAQIEQQNFATSFIPTVAANVTRSREQFAYVAPFQNPRSEGALVIDTYSRQDPTQYAQLRLFGTNDSRGSAFELRTAASGAWTFVRQSGGGFFNVISASFRGKNSTAFQLAQNGANIDWAAVQNGVVQGSGSVSGTLDHSNLDQLSLGTWPLGVSEETMSFRGLKAYDAPLPIASLIGLTS